MRRVAVTYLLLVLFPLACALGLVVRWEGNGVKTAVRPLAAGGLFRLLLAMAVVVALAAVGGVAARAVRQPTVVGELLVGLSLGPSALGTLWPGLQGALFPASVVAQLETLAQVGIVFFMFLVGLELPVEVFRRGMARALVTAHGSVAVPFLGGVLLAAWLGARYRPPGVGAVAFLLFLGISLAISALPVLARILEEQGLIRTEFGRTALAVAAIADVTAWAALALVLAAVRGGSLVPAATAMLLGVVHAAVMVRVVGPVVGQSLRSRAGGPAPLVLAGLVCLVLASALLTDALGLHAIFGAFLVGVVLPRDEPTVRHLADRLEGLTVWVLLPLFFVTVGLHTSVGALGGVQGWMVLAVVVVTSVVTKFAGTMGAAVAAGLGGRQALVLGTAMNCRGLTELVVLSIGRQVGVLPDPLFSMMVVMAFVTTAMTAPGLYWATRGTSLVPGSAAERRQAGEAAQVPM